VPIQPHDRLRTRRDLHVRTRGRHPPRRPAQLPAEAHDTEARPASRALFSAPGPGTPITRPREPAVRTAADCPHPASPPTRARPMHQVMILLKRRAIPSRGPPPSARRRRVLSLYKQTRHAPGWLAQDDRKTTVRAAGNPGRPEPAPGRGRQSSARGGSAAAALRAPSRTGHHAPAPASEPARAARCGPRPVPQPAPGGTAQIDQLGAAQVARPSPGH
jgi:hypothetical protein